MIKSVFLVISIFYSSVLFAQKDIKLEEASKYVGDSVQVCGKIYSTRFFVNAQDAPTLLNIGAAYPDQLLTIVIYGNVRKEFTEAPETYYKDKIVCVTGKVSLYKEKPQIIIYSKKQVIVKD